MTSQRETSGKITLVPEVFLQILLRERKSKPRSGEVRWPIRVMHSTICFFIKSKTYDLRETTPQ